MKRGGWRKVGGEGGVAWVVDRGGRPRRRTAQRAAVSGTTNGRRMEESLMKARSWRPETVARLAAGFRLHCFFFLLPFSVRRWRRLFAAAGWSAADDDVTAGQ